MDNILLLQTLPGFGRGRVSRFLRDNPIFVNDDDYMAHFVRGLTGRKINFYMDRVKRIKESCSRLDVSIIRCDKWSIFDPPPLLYIKGDCNIVEVKKRVAVVGTREPTSYGERQGRIMVEEAVKSGWVTVSGLARGCDTLAHKTTIREGGSTIAVLPHGYYPGTAPWILDSGIFISEYPPYEPIRKYRCVERNRIITGVSLGLYLIESRHGGGSEHSLRFAHKMGQAIVYSYGFNHIEDYGAKKVGNRWEFDQFLKNCIK